MSVEEIVRLHRLVAQRRPRLLPFCIFAISSSSYVAAALALDQETNGGLKGVEVCDNIDLEMVLMEYESYHYIKFQKYPKVIRRAAPAGKRSLVSAALREEPAVHFLSCCGTSQTHLCLLLSFDSCKREKQLCKKWRSEEVSHNYYLKRYQEKRKNLLTDSFSVRNNKEMQ